MVSLADVRTVERALVSAPRTGAHIGSRFADARGWTTTCGRYVPSRRAQVRYGQAGVDFAEEHPEAMCPECAAFAISTAHSLPTREDSPRLPTQYDLMPYWLRVR